MSHKIKEIITDKYWIVESAYAKIGTIRKVPEGYEFFDQIENTKTILDTLQGFKSATVAPTDTTMQVYKGLPTNATALYPVDHPTLPAFQKSKNGKTIFVAGYYILKYTGMGWQHAFCPKLETVDKYENRGPYFTEWDMNLNLKKAKSEPKNETSSI